MQEPTAPSALLEPFFNPEKKQGASKRRRGRLADPKPL